MGIPLRRKLCSIICRLRARKYMKISRLLHRVIMPLLLAISLSHTSLAETGDAYEAKLIISGRSKFGFVAGKGKSIKSQILVTRNKKEVLRLPILTEETSFGFTMGKFGSFPRGFDSLSITEINGNTKISDFFYPFLGFSTGGALALPPCCKYLGENQINAENSERIILSGKLKMLGVMADYSATRINFKRDDDFNDRRSSEVTYLSELKELPIADEISSLMSIECVENKSRDYHYITINPFHEIEHFAVSSNPLKMLNTKTTSLKLRYSESTMSLSPETIASKTDGDSLIFDLTSEKEIDAKLARQDYHDRAISYQAAIIRGTSQVPATCYSKSSLSKNKMAIEEFANSVWRE
jgi:hypothetical protein